MSLRKVLNSEVHPVGLKNILSASYAAADRSGALSERHLKPLVIRAAEEGQKWARQFLGNEKRAELIIGRYDATDDLDKMLESLNANPVEENYVKSQLAMGRSPVARYHHNRTIARTSAMNVYVKAALIEMRDDGLTHVRRMEVHDHRTSPICRTLNGTIHEIAKLLSYQFPLTHDSHLNCRGTFVPHFGLGAYRPLHHNVPTNVNIGKFKNAPIEFTPWLRRLGRILPFKKVVFEDLGKDRQTQLEKDTLKVNLLDEEDPREVLLEESARYHWPKMKDNFKEVIALRDMRLIQPSKTYHNDWEFFLHLYQDYRLNQLEDPYLIGWFKSNIP